MPLYVYGTIPTDANEPPRRFEVEQSMKDAALKHDPETGWRVRRVIHGGYLNTQRWTKSPGSPKPAAASGGGLCCGLRGFPRQWFTFHYVLGRHALEPYHGTKAPDPVSVFIGPRVNADQVLRGLARVFAPRPQGPRGQRKPS